jgi:hypothetical protein
MLLILVVKTLISHGQNILAYVTWYQGNLCSTPCVFLILNFLPIVKANLRKEEKKKHLLSSNYVFGTVLIFFLLHILVMFKSSEIK